MQHKVFFNLRKPSVYVWANLVNCPPINLSRNLVKGQKPVYRQSQTFIYVELIAYFCLSLPLSVRASCLITIYLCCTLWERKAA